jgi:hypothetical protein
MEAAVERPPPLKAIIRSHEEAFAQQGIGRHARPAYAAIHKKFETANDEAAIAGFKALLNLHYDPHPWDDLWRSIAAEHPFRDAWWEDRNLLPLLDRSCRSFEAIPIGERVTYRIPLVPNGRRFRAGHTIDLHLTTDDQSKDNPALLEFRHASVGTTSLNTVLSWRLLLRVLG